MNPAIKYWLQAARLRTLPLALSGILTGTALAYFYQGIEVALVFFPFLTAILLQVTSNFANDYGDWQKGLDASRKGPARMVQSGHISPKGMKRAVILFALLSFICGIVMLALSFGSEIKYWLLFLSLGIASICAAIFYTMGHTPYGYAGWGDIFVFLFFGPVSVAGTFFLHTHSFSIPVLLPALAMGLLSSAVLNVNNMRDVETDAISGKLSIPVRIGLQNSKFYHVFMVVTACLALVAFTCIEYRHLIQLIYIFSLPLFYKHLQSVLVSRPSELDSQLPFLSLSTFSLSVLFSLGLYLTL